MSLATDTIYRITFKRKRYTPQRYKRSYIAVMQKKKLDPFCNRSSLDDGSKSGRKSLEYIKLWKINQFPTDRIKAIRQYERINKIIFTQEKTEASWIITHLLIAPVIR